MNIELEARNKLRELIEAEPSLLKTISEMQMYLDFEQILNKLRGKCKTYGIDPSIYPRYLKLT